MLSVNKTIMKRLLMITILVFCCANASAESFGDFIADYLPYLNGKPWPQFPITAYVKNKDDKWVHPSEPNNFPTVEEYHEGNSDFTVVALRLPDGRVFKTYNALVLGPYLAEVYYGDLNNDGIPDFIAIKPGSGNGLAAEYCTGIFAFSENNSYRFTRINTMGLGPSSIVIDPKSGKFRLIQTSFRQSQSVDGKTHSFFVHRFYKWEWAAFRPDSSLPPIWIQFLNKPNHEATKLLTSILKEKSWNEDNEYKMHFNIEW